jgi:hypothetical protein
LPALIGPDETLGIRVAFSLTDLSSWPETLQLQIGANLWEVSGLPAGQQP